MNDTITESPLNLNEVMEEKILASHNLTTESERALKKIEDTLRGKIRPNVSSSSTSEVTSRNEENHVTTEIESLKESTKRTKTAPNSTFDNTESSTTKDIAKSQPPFIPLDFLDNNKTLLGGQLIPELPPSIFDKPTRKKAPFIPVLPATTNNPMAIYNLTDRGVNSKPSQSSNGSPPTGDLSDVTYGAVGIAAIAIIAIIIAFIYKGIKKAASASSGGSYSPKSQHKDQPATRKSSSNSGDSAENPTRESEAISDLPDDKTIIAHAIINEAPGGASLVKKKANETTSNTPNSEIKNPAELMIGETKTGITSNNKEENNIETSNANLAPTSQTHSKTIQQDVDMKNTSDSNKVTNKQNKTKKAAPSINKQDKKIDKMSTSAEKFTSDKTAASNLNQDSLRSLGQALGGLLKDQIPERKNQDMETVNGQKESCTPPTTPTDLSDQDAPKNNQQFEDITMKKSNIPGGETEGDAFFSSGEAENDTPSEYFSADESSYAAKDTTADVLPAYGLSQEKQVLPRKDDHNTEFVLEDGRRRSIEEDIANSLKDSIQTEHLTEDVKVTMVTPASGGTVLVDAAVSNLHTRQRGITMCEDQLIDMEVHEILDGKEPYEVPPDDSPVEEDKKQYQYQFPNEHAKNSSNTEGQTPINVSQQTKATLDAPDEVILKEINLKKIPRNPHLQHIIKHNESSNHQSHSGLDADSVVNDIMKTSKLDYLSTQSLHEDLGTYEDVFSIEINGYQEINSKGEASHINNHQSLLRSNYSTEKGSLLESKGKPELLQTSDNRGTVINAPKKEYPGIGQTSIKTSKWYVPTESFDQELPDAVRGNSDGLYIALSDEIIPPQLEEETGRQQPYLGQSSTQHSKMASESSNQSWVYISINGENGTMNEGWPSHLPRNIYENNASGLTSMKTANAGNIRKVAIQEEEPETDSVQASTVSPGKSKSASSSEVHSANKETASKQSANDTVHSSIPQFELPNMDKRLMKKKRLKRRQIKSLDSGVHSYYGEYMDLVEFPEFETVQDEKQDQELKMSSAGEEKSTYLPSNRTELKIEEDVVTILPDGTIREEKIVIDKISST